MASIQRLKRSYRIMYRDGGRGAPIQYVTTYAGKPITTKADAEAALAATEAYLGARSPVISGKVITLEELVVRWKRARLSGKRPGDAWTVEDQCKRIRAHIAKAGWQTTMDVTPAAVQAWREANLKTERVGTYLRTLLWWGKDFADQPVLETTLAALRPPRNRARRPERTLLKVDQVAEAYQKALAIDPSLGVLLHCLAIYAWRPITAAKLNVGDVTGDEILTRVKGGHEVRHPLLPATLQLLKPLLQGRPPEAPLFTDPRTGRRFGLHSGKGLDQALPHWSRDHLHISIYDLKRYAASHLLTAMPAHEARKFTGHLTTTQLMKYPQSNEDTARESLEKLSALIGKGSPVGAGGVKHGEAPAGTFDDKTPDESVKYAGKAR